MQQHLENNFGLLSSSIHCTFTSTFWTLLTSIFWQCSGIHMLEYWRLPSFCSCLLLPRFAYCLELAPWWFAWSFLNSPSAVLGTNWKLFSLQHLMHMQINFVVHLLPFNFVVHFLPFNFLLIPFIFAVRANVIFISWRVQNVLIDWLIDYPHVSNYNPVSVFQINSMFRQIRVILVKY